jgi:predicted transposase/invertase (TIGR01784 family)
LLTEALEIHFIDMVKFRGLLERDIRGEPLERWLTWFDRGSPEEMVEEAIRMDTGIQRAEEKMAYVSGDKEALRAYQMREMALSDWTSGINHAREEGIREGKSEGIQEIARNLKKIGVPVEQIVQGTGLSIEDIARL